MTQSTNTERSLIKSSARASTSLVRLIVKLALVVLFIGGGLLIGGFLQFGNNAASAKPPADIAAADAIVVLTGGPARIAKGLELLAQKKGRRLLITGVNKTTSRQDIEAINPQRKALFDCCIDLEHEALDTVGNAAETRKWVEASNYKSIVLVTSAQHMPRSLVEFSRSMKDIAITPYPVALKELQNDNWWRQRDTLRPMVSEYLKFLGSKSRDYVDADTLQSLRANMLGG